MIHNRGMDIQPEGLPSLDRFKSLGQRVVKEMNQAVLLSINIRNLKYFNEIYGSAKGDWLISYMVQYYCRENPNYRLGTMSYVDHLLIICEGYGHTKEELIQTYADFAEGFLHEVNKKYGRAKIHIECGMYIVHKGEDFLVAQDNARYARRSIKNSYNTTVAFYSEELRKVSLQKASIIPNFQHAIEHNGVIVTLQPKYSIKNKKIIGAEALSRIYDEEGNVVSPALYVPVLEKAGIVMQLDYEVLRQVVGLLAKWQKEGRELFPISVNLSRLDLMEEGFIQKLDKLVHDAGVSKEYIEFELTETAVVKNLNDVVMKLQSLRDKGYRIALDDFGSGYNSLYVLGQIPANVIKFDRGFVLHSIQNDTGLTILKNLVQTFKEIKFEVLCEGVETLEEESHIVDCGCDVIQGFLYDRPLSIEYFEHKYIYA